MLYVKHLFQCGEDSVEDPLSVYTDIPEAVFGVSHIALSTSHRYNQEQYYIKVQT